MGNSLAKETRHFKKAYIFFKEVSFTLEKIALSQKRSIRRRPELGFSILLGLIEIVSLLNTLPQNKVSGLINRVFNTWAE